MAISKIINHQAYNIVLQNAPYRNGHWQYLCHEADAILALIMGVPLGLAYRQPFQCNFSMRQAAILKHMSASRPPLYQYTIGPSG